MKDKEDNLGIEDEEVKRLLKRKSDARLTWAPMTREEQEDMKTRFEPEDFT